MGATFDDRFYLAAAPDEQPPFNPRYPQAPAPPIATIRRADVR